MLKNTLLFALIVATTLLFTACNSGGESADGTSTETTETSEQNASGGSMTANVDGQGWTTKTVQADYKDGSLMITGMGTDGSKLILEIGEKPIIGIFPINRKKLQAATYEQGAGGSKFYAPFDGATGVINITAIDDNQVSGTFSFSGSNMSKHVLIEDGTFVAPIVTQKPAL